MKKLLAAFGLLVIMAVMAIGPAYAGGLIRDLAVTALDATSVEAVWNCTDKADQLFTLTLQVQGVDRIATHGTHDTYYRFSSLCPDTTYIVTVSAEGGSTASAIVTTPETQNYERFNYTLLDAGVYTSETASADTAVTTVTAASLPDALDDIDYNLVFSFKLTAAEETRAIAFMLALRLPNGDLYSSSDIFWYGPKSQTVSQDYCFNALLETVMSDYGTLPSGDYALTAYFENYTAAEATFTVE